MRQRLFLKTGDQVIHQNYPQWGMGVVVEERSSTLSGGICIVRVSFRDGVERSFINDMDNSCCCYYAGVRLYDDPPISRRTNNPNRHRYY